MSRLENINSRNLRVIKTARTEESINLAARQGFRPLVKSVEPNPIIYEHVGAYQHRVTGEVKIIKYYHFDQGEDWDLVVPYRYYYPYVFPGPFAAYLIPPDLTDGEHVWLEDIIEDIVHISVHTWDSSFVTRLKSGEAIWTKGDLIVQFEGGTEIIG